MLETLTITSSLTGTPRTVPPLEEGDRYHVPTATSGASLGIGLDVSPPVIRGRR
ncbi:MAG: hypothetical protein R3B59_10840 [Dehalococcoidia bacterium]